VSRLPLILGSLAMLGGHLALAQGGTMTLPKSVEAGQAFSIQLGGSGKGTILIVGPEQVLKQEVELGGTASIAAGSLYNAGHYLVILNGSESEGLDVLPAAKPADLTFLAKPSRLPVSLHNGITGAVYTFDAYGNLIVSRNPVDFELTPSSGAVQKRTVTTQNGSAWTAMDSTGQEGNDKFAARVGDISSVRVIRQVPGDPCGLKMSAKPAGQKVDVTTDPIKDCSGNAVPDGTIVTFTENFHGGLSTVDVPIKRGIAEVEMPVHSGATISVASGVVMGNQIGVGK
jgi:hypothetical protein